MKRFKLTPEVIAKSFFAFLFGMVVGFVSFRLITHFSPNFVSALAEKPERKLVPEEKTTFPLKLDSLSRQKTLKNNTDIINVILKNYPNIEEKKEEEEEEELDPLDEES